MSIYTVNDDKYFHGRVLLELEYIRSKMGRLEDGQNDLVGKVGKLETKLAGQLEQLRRQLEEEIGDLKMTTAHGFESVHAKIENPRKRVGNIERHVEL